MRVTLTPEMKKRAKDEIAQQIATLRSVHGDVEIVWLTDVAALVRITENGEPVELLLDPLELTRSAATMRRPHGAVLH